MAIRSLIAEVSPGVFQICHLSQANNSIGTGSAFWSQGYLVTNNHVFVAPNGTESVWVRRNGDLFPYGGVVIPIEEWRRSLVAGSNESNHDFAVLDLPQIRTLKPHSFSLKRYDTTGVGDDVAVFGYPFGSDHLVVHKGIVSSLFSSNRIPTLQVDASVNSSNSGGPLVDLADGNVVGIVTRKATGLSAAFEELKNAIDSNIQMMAPLMTPEGAINRINGVDLIDALMMSQYQMRATVREIERSANVGIGYAFSVDPIIEEIDRHKS